MIIFKVQCRNVHCGIVISWDKLEWFVGRNDHISNVQLQILGKDSWFMLGRMTYTTIGAKVAF
jgi:hypothetical protein